MLWEDPKLMSSFASNVRLIGFQSGTNLFWSEKSFAISLKDGFSSVENILIPQQTTHKKRSESQLRCKKTCKNDQK